MFTANQIVAHLVGDYLLQSDWMAREKHRRLDAAVLHVVFYTLPFVFITQEACRPCADRGPPSDRRPLWRGTLSGLAEEPALARQPTLVRMS